MHNLLKYIKKPVKWNHEKKAGVMILRYNFSDDELFVLCAICGADSVLGITNSFEHLSEAEIRVKLIEISQALIDKGIISEGEGKYIRDQEILEIITILSNPDIQYVIISEDEDEKDNDYIYIRQQSAIHMKNKNECSIQTFKDKEKLNEFIRKCFDFTRVHKDTVQYMVSFASDIIDMAIELVKNDSMDSALVTLNADSLDREEMRGMLESIVYPKCYKTVMGYKHNQDKLTEAIFKICETDKGTWIVKITTLDECQNTMIFKLTNNDISKTLYNF